MKKYGWFGLFAVLIVACGKDTTGPSGPPDLTMKDVVGCWKDNNSCRLKCFDRGGGYYDYWKDGSGDVIERYGNFNLNSYYMEYSFRLITSFGTNRRDTSFLPYARSGNVLIILNADGTSTSSMLTQISPDSFTCGTHWKYFSKPAGWDTLIRPLP